MNIRRNVILNISEVLISAIVLFISYRYAIDKLGIARLGIWAVASAIIALSRAADLGLSAGVTRLIAINPNSPRNTRKILVHAALINGAIYAVISAVLLKLSPVIIFHITNDKNTNEILQLMPAVISSFWIMNVMSTSTATLIGMGRSDLKSAATIIGYLIQLVSTFFLIPRLGLVGLALAQSLQNITIMLLSIIFISVSQQSSPDKILKTRIIPTVELIKSLFSIGLKSQVLTLSGFLFEPLTKFALTRFAGLEAVALYELASRGILQARQIIVTPTSNLTPLFAYTTTKSIARARRIYIRALTAVMLLAPTFVTLMILSGPLVSIILLKEIDSVFMICFSGFGVLWAINIIALPSYFLALGANTLKWSTFGALTTALTSPLLVLLLHFAFGRGGAMIAPGIAVAAGAIITMRGAKLVNAPLVPSLVYARRFAQIQLQWALIHVRRMRPLPNFLNRDTTEKYEK